MKKTILLIALISLTSGIFATVVMPDDDIFGDDMVLQRDMPVHIWGTADPGESVTVSFAGQVVPTTADASGDWMVTLSPLSTSSTGQTLSIVGTNSISFTGVLVGEVWFCSGQSNMGGSFDIASGLFIDPAILAEDLSGLRCFTNRGWLQPDAVEQERMSRVSFYFGYKIYKELGRTVPVAVVPSSRVGTPIQAWMPADLAEKIRVKLNIPADWDDTKAVNQPGVQYTEKLLPFVPMAIRGVLWYQGERNAKSLAWEYRHLLPYHIDIWRNLWAEKSGSYYEFPFYYVQVPVQDPTGNVKNEWQMIRDSMRRALDSTSKTGMAVFYEYGPDVHPLNKEPAGTRAALWALRNEYGFSSLVHSGPLLDGVSIVGDQAVLSFSHIGGGLEAVTGGSDLKFFEIAGADGRFFKANAWIDGNQVVVHSSKVGSPLYVRYLYKDGISDTEVSLINQEGLPASPFISGGFKADGTVELLCVNFEDLRAATFDWQAFSPDGTANSYSYQNTGVANLATPNLNSEEVWGAGIQANGYIEITDAIDVDTWGYSELQLSFKYTADGMGGSDSFDVEYWDGSAWVVLKTYTHSTDFVNGLPVNAASITISEKDYTFPSDMKLRFANKSAGAGNDIVIDDVRLTTSLPLSVFDLYAEPVSGQIALDWSDNTDPGFKDYTLYRAGALSGPYTAIASGLTVSDYLDTAVTDGVSYYYKVKTYDTGDNEISESNIECAKPNSPIVLFEPATHFESGGVYDWQGWTTDDPGDTGEYENNVTISGKSLASEGSFGMHIRRNGRVWLDSGVNALGPNFTQVKVEFNYGTSGMDVVDANSFDVEFWNGTMWQVAKTYHVGVDFAPDDTIYAEKLIFSKSQYVLPSDFKIRFTAGETNKGQDYVIFDEVVITGLGGAIDTTPPAPPANLQLSPGDNEVVLDWDNSTEEDFESYTVYRTTTSGSSYSVVASGIDISSYRDETAVNGTTYYYVVTALDASGNESGYSTEQSATPGVSGFAAWIGAFPVGDASAQGDPDGDSLPNLWEYAFSNTPPLASPNPSTNDGFQLILDIDVISGALSMVMLEPNALPANTTIAIEGTNDLSSAWTVLSAGGVDYSRSAVDNLDGTSTVTYTQSNVIESGSDYKFMRARIETN